MWDRLFDRMLNVMFQQGALSVVYPNGQKKTYGDGTGQPVTVTVHTKEALRKITRNAEAYAGEAYMDGTLTVAGDDLRGFLTVVAASLGQDRRTGWQRTTYNLRRLLRPLSQFNQIGIARRNVAHHYDLTGALYDLFLDADKQYSCGYFRGPDDTLEQAQAQKKAHIAGKLLIEPGMRVLDIGCGWGGMALTLARDHGAKVLGVTLSEEQHRVATERAKAAGLSDLVEFRLQDYRHVTEQFDRIVSVGMFEHVGVPNYNAYFGHVRDTLTEDGIALIHTIGRTNPPGGTNPWIRKYIFPGGYTPAMSEVLTRIEHQGLYPTDIEVWRLHYAETLRHWHARFTENRAKIEALFDARFCRMWNWYLVACEMTFRYNRQCVFQFQLARRQDAVPITRDYLYARGTDKQRHAAE